MMEVVNVISTIFMAFGIFASAIKKDFSVALILSVIFLLTLFLFMI